MVVTIHGLDWMREKWKGRFVPGSLEKVKSMLLSMQMRLFVLSKNMQRYFSERYNRTTCFIPNGIERPKIIEQDLIRREYGLEKTNIFYF